jgi:hypothetical protein
MGQASGNQRAENQRHDRHGGQALEHPPYGAMNHARSISADIGAWPVSRPPARLFFTSKSGRR